MFLLIAVNVVIIPMVLLVHPPLRSDRRPVWFRNFPVV